MGRFFDNPMMLLIILLVVLLLFGAPRLPGMVRSLGQSLRIFKSEVREMKTDDACGSAVQDQPAPREGHITPSV